MPKVPQCENPKMIPFRKFDEYKQKYEKLFELTRTPSGVITARWHGDEVGSPAYWDYPLHRGIGQLCADVGQDAESEVFIIGGSGEAFLALGPTSLPEDSETQKWALYEHSYYDGCNMLEGLVNDVEQPTIGIINGSSTAVHTEIALLCDITIMSEEATIMDPHFSVGGGLYGDGIQISFRELMGRKRSNYALLFGEMIDAQKALDYGMVNEVVPKDKVYERALELGEILAEKPRVGRRIAVQTLRMPLREQMAKELRTTFGTEMWGMMAQSTTHDETFEKMHAVDENLMS